MSAPLVYFQLYSLAANNFLIADEESPFSLEWGVASGPMGATPTTLFSLLRYGPSNNYQVATYGGKVLSASGASFTVFDVSQEAPIPYTPPTNSLTQLGENSRSWYIMPNTVGIAGAEDQHFYQLVNVTAQLALGMNATGQVGFVEPNTQAAAFYITQARLDTNLPNVIASDYFPAGTSAGATLTCSNFGNYSGPFLACINNADVLTNQTPTLSPAVNGSDPVLNPIWTLFSQNPRVVALTEDGGQNVLFVNAIP